MSDVRQRMARELAANRQAEAQAAFYRQRAEQLRKPQDYVQGMERDKMVRDSSLWHPRVMYQYISDKIARALGGQ